MSQNRNLSILADNVNSSGILSPAGGGLGASAVPANGQIPIGNGTNYTVGTLSAGSNISITNAAGSIVIASAIKGLGFGGEIWHNVTSSRALGTSYTNSYTYPIMINVVVANLTNANYPSGNAALIIGGVTVASTGFYSPGGEVIPLVGIVPPGLSYNVTLSGGLSAILGNWAELY